MLKPYEGPARGLVGFDGSEDSHRALQHGIGEALQRDAELVLVHAVDDTVLNSAWGVVFDPEEIKLGAAEMLAKGVERRCGRRDGSRPGADGGRARQSGSRPDPAQRARLARSRGAPLSGGRGAPVRRFHIGRRGGRVTLLR